jgi:DNA primase
MGIVDEDIARVRDASDIVAVVSEHVQLKRVGRRWQGLCPFHSEKSPSFSVNQEEGLYYCFGCSARGDVITFVREVDHLDFVTAVERLASKAGVALRYTDADQGEGRKHKARLVEAVGQAVDWYHERLLSAPDAARARGYLRGRGLDGDTVRAYRIGWAPEGWDVLAKTLRLPADVFVEAGLGYRNRSEKLTDAFRGRVMFPIFDVGGDPVGFGGRVLPGEDGPKYKNSSDSAIYNKSRLLYGLNWAKAAIVEADEVVVCEGYTDVIGFAAAGVPRAVATCGTALTDEHVRVLTSFARRIVLAFDADSAGQNAAERFYAWERQHHVDVAVAALPPGVDPADLAREDPGALEASVRDALPFLQFRLNRILDAAPLDTAEQRARAAEAAVGVLAGHPNDLVRDQYLLQVAARTRTDPDRLRQGLAEGRFRPQEESTDRRRRRGPRRPDPFDEEVDVDGRDDHDRGRRPRRRVVVEGPELEALRLLATRPADIAARLDESLFGDPVAQTAFVAMRDAGSVREALGRVDEDTADLLQQVAAADSEADVDDVLCRVVVEAARRVLRELEAEARTAADPLAYAEAMAWLKLSIEDVLDEHTGIEPAEQLLAWLVQQPEERG